MNVDPTGAVPSRPRLLVVDDHDDSREILEFALEAEGFQVVSAADGESAIARARSEGPFDALLTDLTLPGISGEQLAEALRADPSLQPRCLLAVSGRDLSEHAQRLFDQTWVKPVDVPKLAAQLRSMLKTAPSSAAETPPSSSSAQAVAHPAALAAQGRAVPSAEPYSAEQRRVEEAKARFLTSMAHEIRTPLTPIGAYVHQLQRLSARGEPPPAELPAKLQRQMDRLAHLADQLSDVGRVQAGVSLALAPAPFELDVLLRELVDEQRELIVRTRVQPDALSIRCELPSAPVRCVADRQRVSQALRHVLANAVKFSPAGGQVLVQLTQGDPLRIQVSDQGIGIPEGELAQVARPYFRASNVRDGELPGVGMGLALTQHVLNGHGGGLEVRSKLGQGTTVTLTLPRTVLGS